MKLGHRSRIEGGDLFGRNRRDKLPTNYNGRLEVVALVVLLSVGRRRSAEEGTDGRRDVWCLMSTPGVPAPRRTDAPSLLLPLLSPQKRAPSLSPLPLPPSIAEPTNIQLLLFPPPFSLSLFSSSLPLRALSYIPGNAASSLLIPCIEWKRTDQNLINRYTTFPINQESVDGNNTCVGLSISAN